MNWIEMMGVWCLAGPAALLVGCGPGHTEPWQGTQRQLLLLGEFDPASGEDPNSTSTPAVPRTLVRPDGERTPISGDEHTTFRASAWGLDGDVLLVTDRSFTTWTWSEGHDESTRLHDGFPNDDRATLRIAPDPRYAIVSQSGNDDILHSQSTAYDLTNLAALFDRSSCGGATGYLQWQAGGPEAVLLSNTCESWGEVAQYHLDHYTPQARERLFDFDPEDRPTVRASTAGLVFLEFEEHWQLFDLANDRVVLDQPIDQPVFDVDWSLDGRSLLLTEDTRLTRYYASGQARWSTELGFSPVGVTVSPAGDHVSARSGHGVGQVYLSLVDMSDGSVKRDFLSTTYVSWSPTGSKFAVRRHELDGGMVALGDPESFDFTTLTRRCTLTDGQIREPSWSPDGEWLLCEDACDDPEAEQIHQLVLFDADGTERVVLPCDHYGALHWSPDADSFAVSVTDPGPTTSEDQRRVLVFDLGGNAVDLGPGHLGTDPWRPGQLR